MVWHDMLEQGLSCGLHRIERLMREQALCARPRRRGLAKDRGARSAVAENVLDRQFHAEAPNQKCVADFTYIWTGEKWLYIAAVLDLYSRRIVGWSMHDSMASQLVVDALMMGPWRRGKPRALLHHSDQGRQYTGEHFQQLLKEQEITCSMRRAGEVWDNSAMESFFGSLKTEPTSRKCTAPALMPAHTCSTTSSASIIPRAVIRGWGMSLRYSLENLEKLKAGSSKSAAGQKASRSSYLRFADLTHRSTDFPYRELMSSC
jgi:transposase InsO family protein